MSKSESRKLELIADKLCADLVRQRAHNWCEAAGEAVIDPGTLRSVDIICSRTLDWAHGYSRRFRGVRWAHSNGFSICRAHHEAFTRAPGCWNDWRYSKLGPRVYDAVSVQAAVTRWEKPDVAAVIAGLRAGRFIQGERS